MKARSKRRQRLIDKHLKVRRRFRLRYDGTAYEIVLYGTERASEIELWRSLRDGLWERQGRWEYHGGSERADLIRHLVPALETT